MIILNQIIKFLKVDKDLKINANQEIKSVLQITDPNFSNFNIGWCSDTNMNLLKNLSSGTVIVSISTYNELVNENLNINLIPVEKPRVAFSKVLQEFYVEKLKYGEIHDTAIIDLSAKYNSKEINIGPNVIIGPNVVISKGVTIAANTVIHKGTIIGNDVTIGSNCTIGGVGFGYELNENGDYELMPHIGNVELKDNVEIGNNVCIDRAVLGSTILYENVKVDNLVHIAHGVVIGKNSLIIANSMIAGSVTIGENVWVSPSSAIRQKLTVGDNALVGMGSVVVKNVDSKITVAGNPAKEFRK